MPNLIRSKRLRKRQSPNLLKVFFLKETVIDKYLTDFISTFFHINASIKKLLFNLFSVNKYKNSVYI